MNPADVISSIKALVIDAIREGKELPWQKPWMSCANALRNPFTGTYYSGLNRLLLPYRMHSRGHNVPLFGTFNNWSKAGYSVNKGAKAYPVIFAAFVTKEDKVTKEEKKFFSQRVFNVFNIADTNCPLDTFDVKDNIPKAEISEFDYYGLWAGKDAPSLAYGGDSAFYMPSSDSIQIPLHTQFNGQSEYIQTLMHEIAHSTGHKSRLDRELAGKMAKNSYSFEELIAELAAAAMTSRLGYIPTIENSAAYVQGWLKNLATDPEKSADMIMSAYKQAARIESFFFRTEKETE